MVLYRTNSLSPLRSYTSNDAHDVPFTLASATEYAEERARRSRANTEFIVAEVTPLTISQLPPVNPPLTRPYKEQA